MRVAVTGASARLGSRIEAGLVCCSLEAWDEVERRNQIFVRRLLAAAPDLRVLFVEPPLDRLDGLRRGRWPTAPTCIRSLEGNGRLFGLRPVKWLPRRLGPWADWSLGRQVRSAASVLGLDRAVLWVNDERFVELAAAWPGRVVYDVTDDWTEAGSARERARHRRDDALLSALADEVVVCSAELARRRRRSVHIIPNGVDIGTFREPRRRPADLPSAPIVLYVGTLHEDRLDVELFSRLARALTFASVVAVGPVALARPTVDVLRRAGVHVLGSRPYSEVPAYMQHAAVIVVPHRITPFTESLDPIKAYECLAVGRPVVATPIAGFRHLGPPVVVADVAGFIDAVREQLTRPLPPGCGPLRVAPPDWWQRAVTFGRVLWPTEAVFHPGSKPGDCDAPAKTRDAPATSIDDTSIGASATCSPRDARMEVVAVRPLAAEADSSSQVESEYTARPRRSDRPLSRDSTVRTEWSRPEKISEGGALSDALRDFGPDQDRPVRWAVLFIDHCAAPSGGEIALARLLCALHERVEWTLVLAEDGWLADLFGGGPESDVFGAGRGPFDEPLLSERGIGGPKAGRTLVVPLAERARRLHREAIGGSWAGVVAGLEVLGYVRRLRLVCRRLEPDIVVTNSLKSALYGGLAARLARRPVVWHLRDRISPDYLPSVAVVLVRLAARWLADAVVANSASTLATLPSGGSRGPSVRTVVPDPCPPFARSDVIGDGEGEEAGREGPAGDWSRDPGIGPLGEEGSDRELRTTTSPCSAPRRRFDLPLPEAVTLEPCRFDRQAEQLRVAMIARISPWKGHDVVLRAVDLARRRGVAVRLLVAGAPHFGEEALAEDLRRLAHDLGLDEQVAWLGHVEDVPGLLRAVDVVVHASVIPEPFGQVVVEAMAAGRAVVAALGGGPAEIVTDGVDGLLTPPGDVERLADSLIWLATDRGRRERLSRAARLRARRYAPGRVAREELEVYDRVIAARRDGRRRHGSGPTGTPQL